jgi:hypothetical protein
MALHPEAHIDARKSAPFHVQIELEKTLEMLRHPARQTWLLVQGRVVRVFRSSGELKVGDRIVLNIHVREPGMLQFGPANIDHDDFVNARYFETYLEGRPPRYRLAAYEIAVLDAPTDQPTLTVAQAEEQLENLRKYLATISPEEKNRRREQWLKFIGSVNDPDSEGRDQ